MERETQISAVVSRTTSELLERHVRATGVADVVAHPKLVVTRKSGQAILRQIDKGKALPALRRLLRD